MQLSLLWHTDIKLNPFNECCVCPGSAYGDFSCLKEVSKKHFALSSSIRTQKGCGRPECTWTRVCFSQLVVSDSFNRLPEGKGRTTHQNKLLCLFPLFLRPPHSKHTHIYFSLHLGWRVNCVSAANQGEMRRGTEVRQQILPPLVSQHSPLTHSTGLFYIHSTSPSRRSTSHVMSKAHLLSLTHGQNMMEIGNKVHECIHTYTERNLFTSRTTVYFALKVLGVRV